PESLYSFPVLLQPMSKKLKFTLALVAIVFVYKFVIKK
ncbi:MAG: hypothetical protein ACI8XM_001928, partial [Haloarculaceae archaeon]